MDVLIDVKGLTKRYGSRTAVDNVSFTVQRGDVLGFLGPNAAGKSSTMRMVTGFLPPTAGSATVCGFDVLRDPVEVKRRVGYVPEGAPLYNDMTPRSLLHFVAEVRGISGAAKRRQIDDTVQKVALGGVLHQPIETLSKGYKRRVALGLAILHDPEVLILDEPTDGLDPNQRHEVHALLREMGRDKATVLSTHNLEEVETVCTCAIIIARGRVVVDEPIEALRARSEQHRTVALTVSASQLSEARRLLEAIPGVERLDAANESNGRVKITLVPVAGEDIFGKVQTVCHDNALTDGEAHVEPGRLEHVFRHVTAGS